MASKPPPCPAQASAAAVALGGGAGSADFPSGEAASEPPATREASAPLEAAPAAGGASALVQVASAPIALAGPPAAASEVAELRRVVQLQLSAIKALEARVSALEEAASAARGGATAGSSAPASSPSALNDDHDDEDNDEDVGHPESHVFGDDELRSMMVHSLSVAPRTLVLSPAAGRVGVATTPTFKLVLVGGGGAGCTTLLQRLAQGRSEFPSWAVLLASEADLQQTDTRARSLFLSPFLFSQAAPQ